MTIPPGNLFIVTAPSGAGKTSLVRTLIKAVEHLTVSISHTTRAPRPGEEDGVHYHFTDAASFQALINAGAFIEYAQVFGHYYGTTSAGVAAQRQSGRDVILEIDWQGAVQVRQQFPEAVGIFILPPSRAILEERLRGRNQDSAPVIARRLSEAITEMTHYVEFDYLIVNDDFTTALGDLQAIVRAHRLAIQPQAVRQAQLIQELLTP